MPVSPEQVSRYVKASARWGSVQTFVKESNRIERIKGASTAEVQAHLRLLNAGRMTTKALEDFVAVVQPNARLRRRNGSNVVIADQATGAVIRRPPPGGQAITRALTQLVKAVNGAVLTPYEAHCEFETLHPFTDGNGRAGRALWLWQVLRNEPLRDPFGLSFLHRFYYDALQASRIVAPDQGGS